MDRADDHQRSGVVEGKVWVEVLMIDKTAEALARAMARAEAFDENDADAVFSLCRTLRFVRSRGISHVVVARAASAAKM